MTSTTTVKIEATIASPASPSKHLQIISNLNRSSPVSISITAMDATAASVVSATVSVTAAL